MSGEIFLFGFAWERMMTNKLLCVGTLIIDVINDAIERLLAPGEAVDTRIAVEPGGNAFNVAINTRQSGADEAQIACLGAVGVDDFLFEREMQRHDIIPVLFRHDRTATNIILQIKNETRRYHFDAGANPFLDVDFVTDTMQSFQPDIFYIGETAVLGAVQESLSDILAKAKAAGCITILDLVWASDWSPIRRALPFVDILHGNDEEVAALTGDTKPGDMITTLQAMGVVLPIVSQGSDDLVCKYGDAVYSVSPFSVELVDATGAGDAFVAGFIKKLLDYDGLTLAEKLASTPQALHESLRFASAAGACCVTELGCTGGVSEARILSFLNR